MSAAACIFLHIRDLCRGVCVLNRCNNSLFMVRQRVFEHEGPVNITYAFQRYAYQTARDKLPRKQCGNKKP
jgi:hypothetical protein